MNIRAALVVFCLALVPAAAPAQDEEGEVGEGVDLLGQGARTLLRGLLDEVEPAMRDLAQQLQELNWQGLGIEDLDDYEAPEVLPNGDIILRRKTPKPPFDPDQPEIEL